MGTDLGCGSWFGFAWGTAQFAYDGIARKVTRYEVEIANRLAGCDVFHLAQVAAIQLGQWRSVGRVSTLVVMRRSDRRTLGAGRWEN